MRQLPITYQSMASMMSFYWSKEGVHLVGFVVGIELCIHKYCARAG